MAATLQDVTMHSGDSKTLTVTVYKDTAHTVVKDITGATVKYEARRNANSRGTATIVKSVGSGIVLTDPTNGVFVVTLAATDTNGLSGDFYHEAEVTDAGGDKQTAMTGTLTISKDIIT